jgi:hypothetical protein
MRARSLVMSALVLLCIIALFVLMSAVAFTQDVPGLIRPTPTPDEQSRTIEPSAPASPNALPNLVVESIKTVPADPYVDRQVTIFVTIKNDSLVDVPKDNNFFLDFYINPPTDDLRGWRGDCAGLYVGDCYWGVQWWQVGAGESATFSLVLDDGFPDAASYKLWAQVDTPDLVGDPTHIPPIPPHPQGWVYESNDDDNIYGPKVVTVRTHYDWLQKDHVDFYSNYASTLDVVPIEGTVGIITGTKALVNKGDSALTLGIFDEPPSMSTWGVAPIADMVDYDMLDPDVRVNEDTTYDQRFPDVSAAEVAGKEFVAVVWEDGRNGPTYGRDVFIRWSDDDGETWQPTAADGGDLQVNEKVNSQRDQNSPAVAIAPNGNIVVAWQDHRGSSYDIYAQVFTYTNTATGIDLIPCHQNGECDVSDPCDLDTQVCNFHVDTGANDQNQIAPDIAVDEVGNFYVAWQDARNLNDDIFAARSYRSATACPTTVMGRAALSSSAGNVLAAPDASYYLCWGNDTVVNDPTSTATQAAPSINAMHGTYVADITVVDPGPPPVVDVDLRDTSFVVVAWQDFRNGEDDPDIYLSYSTDSGESFGFDERVNNDGAAGGGPPVEQGQVAVDVAQWTKQISVTVDIQGGETVVVPIEVPVATMNIVWQDYRNGNPDIYLDRKTIQVNTTPPYDLVIADEGQQKVNDDDERAWQTEPAWQGEPDVVAETTESGDNYNTYVVWSDGRNWGGELDNLDIYGALFGSTECIEQLFIGGNNLPLNDGAALHDFTSTAYHYSPSFPPPARQRFPSIAATIAISCPTVEHGYVFVAWQDDRIGNPSENLNIYLARSNLTFGGTYDRFVGASPDIPGWDPGDPSNNTCYASGAFVSEIFDSGSEDSKWYNVDWHAKTDNGTFITLQTRVGNDPDLMLQAEWYPNAPFPYPNNEGAGTIGNPLLGYSAPVQHVVDASGNTCPDNCPQGRYIQYRVNFWARDVNPDPAICEKRTPFLYDVLIQYERPPIYYLPLIFRNY